MKLLMIHSFCLLVLYVAVDEFIASSTDLFDCFGLTCSIGKATLVRNDVPSSLAHTFLLAGLALASQSTDLLSLLRRAALLDAIGSRR